MRTRVALALVALSLSVGACSSDSKPVRPVPVQDAAAVTVDGVRVQVQVLALNTAREVADGSNAGDGKFAVVTLNFFNRAKKAVRFNPYKATWRLTDAKGKSYDLSPVNGQVDHINQDYAYLPRTVSIRAAKRHVADVFFELPSNAKAKTLQVAGKIYALG